MARLAEESMPRIWFRRLFLNAFSLFLIALSSSFESSHAQEKNGLLSVERIYSQPSLSGRLNRGLQWSPDGKILSFFETSGTGKDAKTELWTMDPSTGQRHLLMSSEKLETVLPPDQSQPTQATGLGRRAA